MGITSVHVRLTKPPTNSRYYICITMSNVEDIRKCEPFVCYRRGRDPRVGMRAMALLVVAVGSHDLVDPRFLSKSYSGREKSFNNLVVLPMS